VYNVPLSQLSTYLPTVQAVTGAQVRQFSGMVLKPQGTSIVIVGDGRKFLPTLRKKYPQVEVIPVAKLDVNRADLRRR